MCSADASLTLPTAKRKPRADITGLLRENDLLHKLRRRRAHYLTSSLRTTPPETPRSLASSAAGSRSPSVASDVTVGDMDIDEAQAYWKAELAATTSKTTVAPAIAAPAPAVAAAA
jgi:hypothetical protein